MVLEKIEVQASFQDGITTSLQKAINKMQELEVSTKGVATAFERLNKAQGLYATQTTQTAQATQTLNKQTQTLGTNLKKQRGQLHKLTIQAQHANKSLKDMTLEEVFRDEVSARIQNALDTMVEFGASTDHLDIALKKLNKTQVTGTRGMAQQANVLRTLVDESENARFAIKNMERATDIAAKTGLKLEDAGRQLGMAFRGDTTILRNFDVMARKAADAIEKINDPAQRQKMIMKELASAQKRVSSGFGRMENRIARADVSLNKVGLSVASLSRGLLGLASGAVIGAVTLGVAGMTSAIKKFREGNKEAIQSTNALQMSLDRAQDKAGGVLNEFLDLNLATETLAAFIDDLTDSKNSLIGALNSGAKILKVTNDLFAALDKHIIGVTKTTEGGAQAILSFADRLQIVIGLFSEATRKQRQMEQMERKARQARMKRLEDEAVQQKKQDDANQKRLEQEYKSVKDLPEAHMAPGISPITRARLIEEGRAKAAETLGPDAMGPLPLPSDRATTGRGRGRGAGRGRRDDGLEGFKRYVQTITEMSARYNLAMENLRKSEEEMRRFGEEQEMVGGRLQGLDSVIEKLKTEIELTKKINEENAKLRAGFRDAGVAVTDFANGSLQLAIDAGSLFFENLASGEGALKGFGTFLLKSTADLMGQMGQSFILLGAGVQSIQTGLLSPGALIAIGASMVALSGALKGFAKRSEGAPGGGTTGGGTAAALERFGRQIFNREGTDQGREVTINIEGRSMRGYVLDVAADGARRGSVPLTPRRA